MATYEIEIKSKDEKLEFYETVFPRLNKFYENNYKTVDINKAKANKYDSLVKKIKDKIEEIQLPNVIVGGRRNGKVLDYGRKLGKLDVLQELLKEVEDE